MIRTFPQVKMQLLLISFFTIASISLAAQDRPGEDPKEDPPRDEVVVRTYDTQRYFKERRWNTGSGSEMPMNGNIDDIIRKIEAKIKAQEQEVKVAPVTIGLVFHMMNTRDPESAHRAIKTQIEALNRDFNNKNLIEKHPNDPEGKYTRLAASTQITFTTAEDSKYGSGIATLHSSEKPWTTWDQMKDPKYGGAQSIEPSRYLNIWVCDLPSDMGSYASSIYCIDKEDGIVIDSRYFGIKDDKESNYNQGKTLTHLIGNYLGLAPLWGSGGRCDDDNVSDTPRHNDPNYGCPQSMHLSYCDGNPLEMTMNFMDSSNDACLTMFTKGQVQRMHAVLNEVRAYFLNPKNKKL